MKNQPEISETDTKILRALFKDARCNFNEIAKDCHVSTTAIAQRYRKLCKNGTIIGTTLITDSKSQYSLSIDLKAENDCEKAIIEAVKKLPGVLNCFKTIGRNDIHAAIRVNSLEQIDQIKNDIRKEKGVLNLEIANNLDNFFLFPENLLRTTT